MESDAGQLWWLGFTGSQVATIPIVLVYSFFFLFQTLGVSVFSGVGIFVLGSMFGYCLALKFKAVRSRLMKAKDERMNVTNETIQNIKLLKFYQWTDIFGDKMKETREKELK
jgi:hypothetical protein